MGVLTDQTGGGRQRRQGCVGGEVGGEVNTICCVMLCSLSAFVYVCGVWEWGEGGKCLFETYVKKES